MILVRMIGYLSALLVGYVIIGVAVSTLWRELLLALQVLGVACACAICPGASFCGASRPTAAVIREIVTE